MTTKQELIDELIEIERRELEIEGIEQPADCPVDNCVIPGNPLTRNYCRYHNPKGMINRQNRHKARLIAAGVIERGKVEFIDNNGNRQQITG